MIDDDSDPNFSNRYRSGIYDIKIQNDSLLVRIEEITKSKSDYTDSVEKPHRTLFHYKAKLGDIGSIKFEQNQKPLLKTIQTFRTRVM